MLMVSFLYSLNYVFHVYNTFIGQTMEATVTLLNKPQQEGITTKPGYKELFILILQKNSNNN